MSSSNGEEGKKKVKWFTIPIILPEQSKLIVNEKVSSAQLPEQSKPKFADEKVASVPEQVNINPKKRSSNGKASQNGRDFFKKQKLDDESISENSDAEVLPPKSTSTGRKKCALIIDDTKVIRKVFDRALTNLGYEVKQAENGLKGLLQMKATMFDVVFCDFLMPLLDGLDCVQQYRAWEKENRSWFQQVRRIMSCFIDDFKTCVSYFNSNFCA